MSVPRLTTALDAARCPSSSGQLLNATPAIEHWLRSQWQEHAAPFYCSVDLRNAASSSRRSTPTSFPAASTT